MLHMGGIRNACKILVGNLKGRSHIDAPGIDGRIILKRILKEQCVVWSCQSQNRDQFRLFFF
jgi:hypothetical protein